MRLFASPGRWIFAGFVLSAAVAGGFVWAYGDADKFRQSPAGKQVMAAGQYAMKFAAGPEKKAAKPASRDPAAGASVISVTAVDRRQVVEQVTVTGTLVPREEVLVGPEINGLRITELLAEEGDRVKKGQVLARLSRETLDAQIAQSDAALARADAAIAQARSQIAQAEANVQLTSAELKRAEELLRRGAGTRAIVDQRRSAANTAQAQLKVAQAALTSAQAEKKNIEAQRRELMVRVRQTEVKAPAAGIVSRRTAKIGALVAIAGEPLFRIIADGDIELNAVVPEWRLLALKPGMPAMILLADGTSVEGSVRLLSPEVDEKTRLGHLRIALKNDERARIGSFARGNVVVRKSMSLTVPASSVLYRNDKTFVQVVKDGKVDLREVRIGLTTNGKVEVTSGLEQDERVVVRAGAFLRDGDAVKPVERGEI